MAVLGDASYSMDVAIRTATIIASVLTVLSNADVLLALLSSFLSLLGLFSMLMQLKFFNVVATDAPKHPRNAEDALKVAEEVKADGLTASASAIWPYYKVILLLFFVFVCLARPPSDTLIF